METHHRLEIRPVAGQLQHRRAAIAVADRRQPGRIDARLGQAHVAGRLQAGADVTGVGHEPGVAPHHLVVIGQGDPAALIVHGHRHEAQAGQPLGSMQGVI